MSGFWPNFELILPEGLIILTAMWILIEGVFRTDPHGDLPYRFGQNALLSLIVALSLLLLIHHFGIRENNVGFEGQLASNDYIHFAKILILIGGRGGACYFFVQYAQGRSCLYRIFFTRFVCNFRNAYYGCSK